MIEGLAVRLNDGWHYDSKPAWARRARPFVLMVGSITRVHSAYQLKPLLNSCNME